MRNTSRKPGPPKLHPLRKDCLPVTRAGKARRRPAKFALSALAQNSRETLAILEAHRLSWQAFAAMRSDSYEHLLARHSPKLLDEYFTLIFAPGMPVREIRERSPRWPPGTPLAGNLPGQKLVAISAIYWNAERALDLVSVMNDIVEKFRARLDAQPFAQTKEVTDLLCNLLSQELLAAKMEQGTNVAAQTQALQSLLAKQKLDLHAQSHALAAMDDQARALEMCLEESKTCPQVAEMFKQAFAALKEASLQS